MFERTLADSDLYSMFSDLDDTAATSSLYTLSDQDDLLGNDLLSSVEDPSPDWNMFADPPEEDASTVDLISSCSDDNYGQPSKLRARIDACGTTGRNSVQAPQLPNLLDNVKEPDAPNRQFVWGVDVGDGRVYADDPKYYCLGVIPLYSMPVCGSGHLYDRWYAHPPLYPQIDHCSLSKSFP